MRRAVWLLWFIAVKGDLYPVICGQGGALRGKAHATLACRAIASLCHTPSNSARNSSMVAASMRLDLMLALRMVLSRSRFITMWRAMAKLLAA